MSSQDNRPAGSTVPEGAQPLTSGEIDDIDATLDGDADPRDGNDD